MKTTALERAVLYQQLYDLIEAAQIKHKSVKAKRIYEDNKFILLQSINEL